MIDAATWEALKDFASIVTPLLLAVVTCISERSRRESKKVIELREQLHKQCVAKQRERDEKIDETVEILKKQLNETCDLYRSTCTMQSEQSDKIDRIEKLNKLNMQRIRASEKVIITLAEGMRDQHLDGNITAAIAEYREAEAKSIDSIYHTA